MLINDLLYSVVLSKKKKIVKDLYIPSHLVVLAADDLAYYYTNIFPGKLLTLNQL